MRKDAGKKRGGIARIALACYRGHPAALARLFVVQLAARLLALSPLVYALAGWPVPDAVAPFKMYIALGLTAAMVVLLVFPMRFQGVCALRRLMLGEGGEPGRGCYPRLVLAGLIRLASGAIWGLPCAYLAYRLYQYIFVFEGTRLNNDFSAIGAFLAPALSSVEASELGMKVFFGALAAFIVLFLYGWRRGAAFGCQPLYSVGLKAAYARARAVRRRGRLLRLKASVLNMVVLLPPLFLVPAIPYWSLRPHLTGVAITDLQLLYAFIRGGMLSDGTLLWMAAAVVVLYIPFILLRKLCTVASVALVHE